MRQTSEITSAASRETRRTLGYLRDLIEDSDLARSEIEDRSGFSRGYLSRLLNAQIDLKVRHLDALLAALGVAPGQFFNALYPRRRERLRRARRQLPKLKVSADVVRIYGFGIDSIRQLRSRLEECEAVLETVARSGVVRSLSSGNESDSDGRVKGG